MTEAQRDDERASTGVEGLDDILGGGLPVNRLYALFGGPGVGKTTLALQFLLSGRSRSENVLHVTLSESPDELRTIARSHGWSMEGVTIYEPPAVGRTKSSPQTMFLPAEVELEEITEPLLAEVERVNASRVVIDSVSQIRLLARDPLRYRREMVALKRYFATRGCTVLLIDEIPQEDDLLQTVVTGVICLEKVTMPYGPPRGRVAVGKLRGSAFREGFHDYRLRRGGLEVYPRLIAAEHRGEIRGGPLSSAVPELDKLMGGGLHLGTSTLLIGPAGAGKSTLSTLYAASAADRGQSVAMYLFAERIDTLVERSAALGMDIREHLDTGRISVEQIDPAEVSAGELSHRVRRAAEELQVSLVVIDSLNGFFQAVPDEPYLTLHLHELLSYLSQKGVATILVLAQRGLVGNLTQIPIDVSYLADSVLLLRFFEARGRVRGAVSMLKKRSGDHERVIRELRIDQRGVQVGPPLEDFQGVLSGVPEYQGPADPLLRAKNGNDDGGG